MRTAPDGAGGGRKPVDAAVMGRAGTSAGGSIVIGVDVGGTFTDTAMLLADGRVVEGKALTTRDNLVRAGGGW